MYLVADRALLLCFCTALLGFEPPGLFGVVALLGAIICNALCGYAGRRIITISLSAVFFLLALWRVEFCLFLPLALYDLLYLCRWAGLVAAIPLWLQLSALGIPRAVLAVLLLLAVCLLQYRAKRVAQLWQKWVCLRDNSKELSSALEKRNRALLEAQDYEIRLATLSERNRIAREIHDSVGHLLSRSILQVGALMSTADDGPAKEGLVGLGQTLDSAMDSIRASVHDLHDESFSFEMQLRALLREYTFCPVSFEYEMQAEPPRAVAHAFVSITKEALHNTARHSGATAARVRVCEHPALYQLRISDNGRGGNNGGQGGIGLQNMADRVAALGGRFRYTSDQGFEIFISVPKEGADGFKTADR